MASFMFYDLIFLALFCIFVVLFLYKRRKKLGREGPMFLYRTSVGLKIIDYFGKKHSKFIGYVEYVVMFCGYLLMAIAVVWIGYFGYFFLKFPDFFRIAKIPPIAPLIPYFGEIFKADYLPPFYFTYWIVVLGVTAVCHEFFHGIFARKNNVRIKSTGFGFMWGIGGIFLFFYNKFRKKMKSLYAIILTTITILTIIALVSGSLWYLWLAGFKYAQQIGMILALLIMPFLGAFVEQDEKDMKKAKAKSQMSILAAGSFANLLLTILFFGILILFNFLAFAPSGAIFNSYSMAMINSSDISGIGEDTLEINFGNNIGLTQVYYGNKSYFARTDMLGNLSGNIVVFEDAPAIRAGILGAITEIDGTKIRTQQSLKLFLASKKPGDLVTVKVLDNRKVSENKIILSSRPDDSSEADIGVAIIPIGSSGIFGKIRESISFFRDPYTYYSPKAAVELTIFIYNLLWWMILINLSVAIFNMFPAWIFDGGRFFYLMLLRTTKSKKIAEKSYKLMTYLFFALIIMLILMWAYYAGPL